MVTVGDMQSDYTVLMACKAFLDEEHDYGY